MSLRDFYREGRCGLSFELFPPKTEKGEDALFRHLQQLMTFAPDYVTCTYGAGGSTRDKTLGVVERVRREFGIPVASHLTCVGATVDQLKDYLQTAKEREIDYIVALRGDPPAGETEFRQIEGGLCYANELVSVIRETFPDFGIAVAGYPETHQEAPSADVDLDNLKRKVDSGADVVITQLFYNNDDFYRFRDRCQAVGITVPLVPGLMPVTNLAQIQRITSMCGAKLPNDFVSKLSAKDDPQWQFEVGVEQATAQAQGLIANHVAGLHFYVLNKSAATAKLLDNVEIPR